MAREDASRLSPPQDFLAVRGRPSRTRGVAGSRVGVTGAAVLDRAAWTKHFAKAWAPSLYFFCGDKEIYSRMFSPLFGIEEDPATGSAAVAMAGVLGARLPAREGTFTWHIDQGVAMGRPSRLEAIAEKRDGKVVRIKVGGSTVIGAEGTIDVPSGY